MKIELKKFGTTLVSRQNGREAYLAFLPSLKEVMEDEEVNINFADVITFSPSWGDEFLRPMAEQYGERLILLNTDNPSVVASLDIIERSYNLKFKQENQG
ncbi:MAG TPA: hypothetical protein VJL36_00205 [Candidatus Paceibacterota bacterium]